MKQTTERYKEDHLCISVTAYKSINTTQITERRRREIMVSKDTNKVKTTAVNSFYGLVLMNDIHLDAVRSSRVTSKSDTLKVTLVVLHRLQTTVRTYTTQVGKRYSWWPIFRIFPESQSFLSHS